VSAALPIDERRERVWIAVAASIVAWVIHDPTAHPATLPGGEAQELGRTFAAIGASLAQGQGFPLWDRSHCGGIPLVGNPDVGLLSAAFVALTRIPAAWMLRLYPLVMTALAVGGGAYWGRRALRLSLGPSILLGAAFAASGTMAFGAQCRPAIAAFAMMPWVLGALGDTRAFSRRGVRAGLWLAALALEGGVFATAMTLLFALAIELTAPAIRPGKWRSFGAMLALGLPLAALRLVPEIASTAPLGAHASDETMKLSALAALLVDRDRTTPAAGLAHAFGDYRSYVGPLLAGMAIAGTGSAVVVAPRRWAVPWLVVAALALVIGPSSPVAPGSWLPRIPAVGAYGSFGGRYLPLLALGIAAGAAVAIELALAKAPKRTARAMIAVVGAMAVADPAFAASAPAVLASVPMPSLASDRAAGYAITEPGPGGPMAVAARGQGVASCQTGWPYPAASGLQLGERPQAWIEGRNDGVRVQRESSTRIDLELTAPVSRVVINQTYDADWTASVGDIDPTPRGLTLLGVPAGTRQVTLRYRPRALLLGAVLSLLASAGGVAMLVRRRRSASRARSSPGAAVTA
jgi:hypothetical protein